VLPRLERLGLRMPSRRQVTPQHLTVGGQ
jgi:hypothetical protein